MKIKADDTTIGEQPLLGASAKNIFRIPAYQRAYTWSQDQWDDLYNDLSDSKERQYDSHFIGTFVFIQSNDDGKTIYEVVDGQQRLTTISILFLALYQHGCEILYDYYGENDQNIKENNNKYRESLDAIKFSLQFLYSRDQISRTTGSPDELKLRLSKCSNNNENYRCLCRDVCTYSEKLENMDEELDGEWGAGKYPEWKKSGDGRSLIYRAHKYFYDKIKKEIYDKTVNDRIASVDMIRNYIAALRDWDAVVIIAENTHDACLLFDSLNNRGVALSPIDIVKNKLFERLMQDTCNLDEYEEQWKELVDRMRSAKILRRFFVDYYNATHIKYGTKKYINEIEVIDEYSELIDKLHKENKVRELFDDLQQKAVIYQIISDPESPNNSFISDNEDYKCLLIALVSISAIPAYGFLLYLYDKLNLSNPIVSDENKKCFIGIIKLLGKFFSRRHVTDVPRVKYLAPIFNSWIKKYDDAGAIPVESLTLEQDFMELLDVDNKYRLEGIESLAFKLENIEYETQNTRLALIRYLFTQLEYSRKGVTGKHVYRDLWRKEGQGRSKPEYAYTIEHIVPQGKMKIEKDRKSWEEMLGKEDLERREEYVDFIGNLILTKINKEAAQKSFDEKKGLYAQSGGNEYSYVQYVLAQQKWDRAIIESHTSELCTEMAESLRLNGE